MSDPIYILNSMVYSDQLKHLFSLMRLTLQKLTEVFSMFMWVISEQEISWSDFADT